MRWIACSHLGVVLPRAAGQRGVRERGEGPDRLEPRRHMARGPCRPAPIPSAPIPPFLRLPNPPCPPHPNPRHRPHSRHPQTPAQRPQTPTPTPPTPAG